MKKADKQKDSTVVEAKLKKKMRVSKEKQDTELVPVPVLEQEPAIELAEAEA